MDQIYTAQKPSTSQGADAILIALIDLIIAAEKASERVQPLSDLPLDANIVGKTQIQDRVSSARTARLLRAAQRKERLSSQPSSVSSRPPTGGLDIASAVATAEVGDLVAATVDVMPPAADAEVASSATRASEPVLQMFVPGDASSQPDTNGIVYWLGTANGTEPWINPMLRQTILVTMSSMQGDSKPAMSVVGRDAVRCVTRNEPRQSITIDLKGNCVLPTHYLLRHYSRLLMVSFFVMMRCFAFAMPVLVGLLFRSFFLYS